MATSGKTTQILVHEDLAAYLLEIRKTKGTIIHKQIDEALSIEFVKKYNQWAKKHNKRQIEQENAEGSW